MLLYVVVVVAPSYPLKEPLLYSFSIPRKRKKPLGKWDERTGSLRFGIEFEERRKEEDIYAEPQCVRMKN
jgi:hypothetical protein